MNLREFEHQLSRYRACLRQPLFNTIIFREAFVGVPAEPYSAFQIVGFSAAGTNPWVLFKFFMCKLEAGRVL